MNEANQSPSAQIDEPLAPKASEENAPAGPLASTCPRSLEQILQFPKAQLKAVNNK